VLEEYVKTEKYGRILADVYLGETNINKWMLEQHLAVEYNGGTKKLPKSWIKYRSTGEM
jgi:endonuclease YncB( thermonuclease family)